MHSFLIVLLVITGIVFVASVLLSSPKGWLGLGIGWFSSSNEYGSKKSLEGKIKKVSLVSAIAFVVISAILPYVK